MHVQNASCLCLNVPNTPKSKAFDDRLISSNLLFLFTSLQLTLETFANGKN